MPISFKFTKDTPLLTHSDEVWVNFCKIIEHEISRGTRRRHFAKCVPKPLTSETWVKRHSNCMQPGQNTKQCNSRVARERQLEGLKNCKLQAENAITSLQKSADELAPKAEQNTGNVKEALSLITESNSFYRTVKDKQEIVLQLNSSIADMQSQLKETWLH